MRPSTVGQLMRNTGPSRVSATRALSLRCEILPLHLIQHAIYYLQRLEESACEKMKGRRTVSEDGSKAAAKHVQTWREGGIYDVSVL